MFYSVSGIEAVRLKDVTFVKPECRIGNIFLNILKNMQMHTKKWIFSVVLHKYVFPDIQPAEDVGRGWRRSRRWPQYYKQYARFTRNHRLISLLYYKKVKTKKCGKVLAFICHVTEIILFWCKPINLVSYIFSFFQKHYQHQCKRKKELEISHRKICEIKF